MNDVYFNNLKRYSVVGLFLGFLLFSFFIFPSVSFGATESWTHHGNSAWHIYYNDGSSLDTSGSPVFVSGSVITFHSSVNPVGIDSVQVQVHGACAMSNHSVSVSGYDISFLYDDVPVSGSSGCSSPLPLTGTIDVKFFIGGNWVDLGSSIELSWSESDWDMQYVGLASTTPNVDYFPFHLDYLNDTASARFRSKLYISDTPDYSNPVILDAEYPDGYVFTEVGSSTINYVNTGSLFGGLKYAKVVQTDGDFVYEFTFTVNAYQFPVVITPVEPSSLSSIDYVPSHFVFDVYNPNNYALNVSPFVQLQKNASSSWSDVPNLAIYSRSLARYATTTIYVPFAYTGNYFDDNSDYWVRIRIDDSVLIYPFSTGNLTHTLNTIPDINPITFATSVTTSTLDNESGGWLSNALRDFWAWLNGSVVSDVSGGDVERDRIISLSKVPPFSVITNSVSIMQSKIAEYSDGSLYSSPDLVMPNGSSFKPFSSSLVSVFESDSCNFACAGAKRNSVFAVISSIIWLGVGFKVFGLFV